MDSVTEKFLLDLKSDGRSSPRDWHEFHVFLKSLRKPDKAEPPVPLILAASGESDASKHTRLGRQLQWATDNGCAEEALTWLRSVPVDGWNSSPPARWHQTSYPW